MHVVPFYERFDMMEMNKIIQKFFLAVIWGFGAHLEVVGRD